MSYDICRSISANSRTKTLSYSVASSNLSPRTYESVKREFDSVIEFEVTLNNFYTSIFAGYIKFLPSLNNNFIKAFNYGLMKGIQELQEYNVNNVDIDALIRLIPIYKLELYDHTDNEERYGMLDSSFEIIYNLGLPSSEEELPEMVKYVYYDYTLEQIHEVTKGDEEFYRQAIHSLGYTAFNCFVDAIHNPSLFKRDETFYININTGNQGNGYLRTINGVMYLSNHYTADVFDMNEIAIKGIFDKFLRFSDNSKYIQDKGSIVPIDSENNSQNKPIELTTENIIKLYFQE